MLTRRRLAVLTGCAVAAAGLPVAARAAVPGAAAFIKQAGDRFLAVINAPGTMRGKQQQLRQIVEQDVDVTGVGRFVLGRFWRVATPAEQQQYMAVFRQILVYNVTTRIGDYKGATFTIGRTTARAEGTVVDTTINAPNNPPTQVQWVVQDVGGQPKIVDVIAEGTSMRLTQRSDYASVIVQNGGKVAALIAAMQHQLAGLQAQPG